MMTRASPQRCSRRSRAARRRAAVAQTTDDAGERPRFWSCPLPSTTSVLWDRACSAPFRASLADDAPAVVVTADCARTLNDFVDESNDTRRFVGAVAARSKVARAVDSTKCPPTRPWPAARSSWG